MKRSTAYSVEEMRRGDLYVDQDNSVVVRDYKGVGMLHYVSPFGAVWEVHVADVAWPVDRVYRQIRDDMEDPREAEKKFEKRSA